MEGHSQTEGLPLKTAFYFHAAYLPNLRSFKLCKCAATVCVFFHPKAKYEDYQGPSVFTALWVHMSTSCIIIWHNRERERERVECSGVRSCFDHINSLCSVSLQAWSWCCDVAAQARDSAAVTHKDSGLVSGAGFLDRSIYCSRSLPSSHFLLLFLLSFLFSLTRCAGIELLAIMLEYIPDQML